MNAFGIHAVFSLKAVTNSHHDYRSEHFIQLCAFLIVILNTELLCIDELEVAVRFFWAPLSQNEVVKHGIGGNSSLGTLRNLEELLSVFFFFTITLYIESQSL